MTPPPHKWLPYSRAAYQAVLNIKVLQPDRWPDQTQPYQPPVPSTLSDQPSNPRTLRYNVVQFHAVSLVIFRLELVSSSTEYIYTNHDEAIEQKYTRLEHNRSFQLSQL